MNVKKLCLCAGLVVFKAAGAVEVGPETPAPAPVLNNHPSDPSQQSDMNIHQGNKIISAGFSMAGTSRPGGSSSFNLGTAYNSFVVERLTLGAALSLERDTVLSLSPYLMVGPRVSWYFWAKNMLAAYVTLGADRAFINTVVSGRVLMSLGIHSFVSQSVAVGPFFTLRRVFANVGSDFTNFNAGANFAFYF